MRWDILRKQVSFVGDAWKMHSWGDKCWPLWQSFKGAEILEPRTQVTFEAHINPGGVVPMY